MNEISSNGKDKKKNLGMFTCQTEQQNEEAINKIKFLFFSTGDETPCIRYKIQVARSNEARSMMKGGDSGLRSTKWKPTLSAASYVLGLEMYIWSRDTTTKPPPHFVTEKSPYLVFQIRCETG